MFNMLEEKLNVNSKLTEITKQILMYLPTYKLLYSVLHIFHKMNSFYECHISCQYRSHMLIQLMLRAHTHAHTHTHTHLSLIHIWIALLLHCPRHMEIMLRMCNLESHDVLNIPGQREICWSHELHPQRGRWWNHHTCNINALLRLLLDG